MTLLHVAPGVTVTNGTPTMSVTSEFERELSAVLNRYSRENASNTPDFILAQYLIKCLEAFELTSRARETWYGKELKIGM